MERKIFISARLVLGLIYAVFGGMGLAMAFGFMQMPQQPMPEPAMGFMKGMMGTGYFFPLLKMTETICGVFLLVDIAAPLALVVLAPVTLQIMLFHSCLTPGAGNLVLPLIMVITHVIAMSAYWSLYRPLLTHRK